MHTEFDLNFIKSKLKFVVNTFMVGSTGVRCSWRSMQLISFQTNLLPFIPIELEPEQCVKLV